MEQTKNFLEAKISNLPLFKGSDTSNLKLAIPEWKKGQKPIYSFLVLAGLIGGGYLLFTAILPILVVWIKMMVIGSALIITYLSRNSIVKIFKYISRKIAEFAIRNDIWGTFEEQNRILSEKRANTVADYLANKGINYKIIQNVSGAGSSKPLGDNNTKEGRDKNRRVQITLLR